MFARVGRAAPLLPTVALEHRGVQIQAIAGRTFRQPLQLPLHKPEKKRWHCPWRNV